ncbi:host attachment family protein [Jiella avicenniae]|uniref:Host attachment family protein n=1 Tax=Jiella avicenniae TaxID=2907202 RepID=A0A9X1T664_9HYPH|nr:host attachment family protein [Jiella avicenniae]MCE7029922.1 host attachment family protein [Jiella avicenniae]
MLDKPIDYKTWILVADGEKALFLENVGDGELPNFEIRRVEEHENPPAREQGANKPGRMSDAGSGHRSAVEDTDWHRLEKERFAAEIADILYRMAHRGRFEKIVIAAPPRILGEMRQHYHKEVVARIVGEVDKDFTNHPLDQIEKRLAA